MKITLTFLLLISFLQTSHAWTELTGNIRGIVTNQESGQVIRGATVKLVLFDEKQSKFLVKSFSQDAGEFLFNDIPPGLYNLECSAFGFKTTRLIGVQIREDRTKLAYFKMERGSAAEITEIYTYAALEAKQKASTQTSTVNKSSLGDAPATIYVVTAEDIEDNGYMSLNEVLENIPEFEIQYRNNPREGNAVSARGIYGNDKLLILRNGHRYNSMVNTQYTLMENYGIRYAERIEIILGPASALYGADAYMGVVNIITAKGSDLRAASITGSYGNFNTTSNAFQFGWGTDKASFALDAGVFYTEGAPINEIYEDEFRLYNNQYLTNGSVQISPFNNTSRNIAIEPFSLERRGVYLNGRFDYKKFNFAVSLNRESHSSSAGIKGQYSPYWQSSKIGNAIINLNFSQGYAFKKGSKWSASTNVTSSLMTIVPNSNFVTNFSSYNKAYKAGVDVGGRFQTLLSYQLHKKHSISAGIDFQHSISLPRTSNLPNNINLLDALGRVNTVEQDIFYAGTDEVDSDGNSLKIYQNFYYLRRWLGAGFLEYRGNIADKLLITIGMRYDQIVDVNEYARSEKKPIVPYANFSPRVGLVYKPFKNLNFKAFFGQGFLQPSPGRKYDHFGTFMTSDDGNSVEGAFWRTPNNRLAPEQVRTLELSTAYSKGDFTIGINSYYNTVLNPIIYQVSFYDEDDNPINFLGIPLETEQTSINSTDPSLAYGTTLSAAYRLIFGKEEQLKINFRGSYSLADGYSVGFEHLPYTATHTAKAGILFKYYNFSLSNNLLFRSETYSNTLTDEDGNAKQYQSPSFFIWNAFARYKVLDKKKFNLSVFVKVNNVLNSRYYNVTDNSNVAMGASPQDPIRFMGGLSVNFGRAK